MLHRASENAGEQPGSVLGSMQTMSKGSHLLQTQCETFLKREYGLSWPGFCVLRAIYYEGRTMIKSLCADLACTNSNITGIVDRLERDGWLERVRSTEDRRIVSLALTQKGALLQEVERRLHTYLTPRLGPWLTRISPLQPRLSLLDEQLALAAADEMLDA